MLKNTRKLQLQNHMRTEHISGLGDDGGDGTATEAWGWLCSLHYTASMVKYHADQQRQPPGCRAKVCFMICTTCTTNMPVAGAKMFAAPRSHVNLTLSVKPN